MTVTHPVTLAMLLWMGIALLTFLLMSVWTDNPQHRSTYRHWAVAYLAALIVFIAIFYSEGTPMAVLIIVLKTIVAILSVLLSLLILLHKGKGGGLSDMFGGGLTANAGTSGVAEKNLNRWTVGIAILWVLLIVSISLIAKTI